MQVIVTGAAGFIGSHVAERLAARGDRVIGIDNFDDYYDPTIKERNAREILDAGVSAVRRLELAHDPLADAIGEADAIVHLAAQAGVRGSWGPTFRRYLDTNVLATQRLLEHVAQREGAFVFVSSSSVYGSADARPLRESDPLVPGSPYGVSKQAAEELTHLYGRQSGLRTVCLRPFSVYGPRERPDKAIQRFLTSALSGAPIRVHGDGTQERDFTFVGDVVTRILEALDTAPTGSTINICRGEPVSVNAIIDTVKTVTGRTLTVEHGPPQAGDVRRTWGDGACARELLGELSFTSLEDGIAAQWAHVQAAHARGPVA